MGNEQESKFGEITMKEAVQRATEHSPQRTLDGYEQSLHHSKGMSRRQFVQRVSQTAAGLATMAACGSSPPEANDQTEPRWELAKTVSYQEIEVSLSKPRLLARSPGYLWFPTMTRLSGGELFANFSTNLDAVVADRTASASWSADDGLTWSEPTSIKPDGDLYAETMLRLKNGDQLLLPFNLYPDGEAMRGWHQTVSGKPGERRVTFIDKSLTVSGWPRPDRSFNEKLGLSGFGFNGHGLMGNNGEYLATMYGYFKGDSRYSLVMVESSDGLAWKYRSLIAGADCSLAGREGPCESQTVRLQDGRLMNIFRLDSSVSYGQTFSDDDGRTWSPPLAMKEAHAVQPSIAIMKDGTLVLTGGRPGIFAWINTSGDGGDWLQVDLLGNHNKQHSEERISVGGAFTLAEQTTSYTEVVPLDEQSVLVMYDRIPHGWSAIPRDSQDTNSIWVVKLALRQIRCAVYYKYLDKEFEFRLVESEEFEDEVLLISVPVSGSLESSDFVVDSFHGTARDRIVIPIENSRSVALQSVGHSLKDANTCCSRASAPVIKEDGGRCLTSLSPDLSEVFLEVVTDMQ